MLVKYCLLKYFPSCVKILLSFYVLLKFPPQLLKEVFELMHAVELGWLLV